MPYLRAFLCHHQVMGIDLFDILVQEPHLIPLLDRLSKDLGIQLRAHLLNSNKTPSEVIRNAEISSDRDYVLLLDPDEYLFLPGHSNLALFLAANHYPQSCYLRWVVTPSDFSDDDRCLGYLGHIGKHLAASRVAAGIATAHTFSLDGLPAVNPFQFERHDGLVIHYWGRTFRDAVLKCLYYRGVHKSKQSSVMEIKNCSDASSLPSRLKLLAALNLHTRYLATPDLLRHQINLDLEYELLSTYLSDSEIECIEMAYCDYKHYLGDPGNASAYSAIQGYPGLYSIQKLAEVLPDMPKC
jgi:hypothetical protein